MKVYIKMKVLNHFHILKVIFIVWASGFWSRQVDFGGNLPGWASGLQFLAHSLVQTHFLVMSLSLIVFAQ